MRINHNLPALNTYGNLGKAAAAGSKSMEKLSSGLRINRAGDDAAGLAISEKMRGQIRGLDQASRNSQDGISLIQTAEGALSETHSILQRMRELAVQSSNDTNVGADRDALQNEISQLTQEIDRIGNTTEFNTRKLLNGGANVSGTASDANVKVVGGTGDTKVGTQITHGATAVATSATATRGGAFTSSAVAGAALELNVNGTSFSFGVGTTNEQVAESINNAGLGVTATFSATDLVLTANNVGTGSSFTSNAAAAGTIATSTGTDATIVATAGFTQYSAKGNVITIEDGNAKGLQLEISGVAGAGSTVDVDSNGTLSMQIGANQGQDMNISLSDMRSAALGVSGIDISSSNSAKTAITTINDAITSVSTERAKLGAFQNRLEHTINNLNTSSENLTAAESRVRDVDMAKEMMEFTKNNILQQAAQAMLAQANQAPQGVLQLLR